MSRLALAMAAMAAAQSNPPNPAEELIVSRPLQEIPGIQINYYDVSGVDAKAVNRAIKERGKAGSARTDWNVVVSLEKSTTDAVCTITGSNVKFNAVAALPRLAHAPDDGTLPLMWQVYVSGVESDLATKLWFAYDRVKEIERGFVGKPCEQSAREGQAAIAQLKRDFAALSAPATPPQN